MLDLLWAIVSFFYCTACKNTNAYFPTSPPPSSALPIPATILLLVPCPLPFQNKNSIVALGYYSSDIAFAFGNACLLPVRWLCRPTCRPPSFYAPPTRNKTLYGQLYAATIHIFGSLILCFPSFVLLHCCSCCSTSSLSPPLSESPARSQATLQSRSGSFKVVLTSSIDLKGVYYLVTQVF